MSPDDSSLQPDPAPAKRRGGRPRSLAADLRTATIGVRVTVAEYDLLRAKAGAMAMTPAQWLREAALTRRLPAPPVAAINREQYADLGRLAANLNQLTRLANEGQRVTIATELLGRLSSEVGRLRFGLLGAGLDRDIDAPASK